jgi:hypothetical protein
MKGVMKKFSFFGSLLLAGSFLTVSLPGAAAAKNFVAVRHARAAACECRAPTPADTKPELAALRYYGGPKSPMWR